MLKPILSARIPCRLLLGFITYCFCVYAHLAAQSGTPVVYFGNQFSHWSTSESPSLTLPASPGALFGSNSAGGASTLVRWSFSVSSTPATARSLQCAQFPADWSVYDTLRFWVYRPADSTGAINFSVFARSPSATGASPSGFKGAVMVDRPGWTEVSLPFSAFRPTPDPVFVNSNGTRVNTVAGPSGWNNITGFELVADGGGSTPARSLTVVVTRFHLLQGNALDDLDRNRQGMLLAPTGSGWSGGVAEGTLAKSWRGAIRFAAGAAELKWTAPVSLPPSDYPLPAVPAAVPGRTPILRFWLYYDSLETTALNLTVTPATTTPSATQTYPLAAPAASGPPGYRWRECWIPLTALAGRVLKEVKFTLDNPSAAALVVVDNVRLDSESDRVLTLAGRLGEQPSGLGESFNWTSLASNPAVTGFVTSANSEKNQALVDTLNNSLWLDYTTEIPAPVPRVNYESPFTRRSEKLVNAVIARRVSNDSGLDAWNNQLVGSLLDEPVWHVPENALSGDDYRLGTVRVILASTARGWTLATADRLLGNRLSAPLREKLRLEVQQRLFNPFGYSLRTGITSGGLGWRTTANNINAVCHAGLVGAGLALLESRLQRAALIEAAEIADATYLDSFLEDGYNPEGIAYWNYGFGHYVLRNEAVRLASTQADDPLVGGGKMERISRYAQRMELANNLYPAFGDQGLADTPDRWLTQLLASRLNFAPPTTVAVYDEYKHPLTAWLYQVVYWLSNPPVYPVTASDGSMPRRDFFTDAQAFVLRSNSPAGLAVALRGGANNEPHDHSDVCTYVVSANGLLFAGDPGKPVYTTDTFSAARYEDNTINSFGHPLPMVADRPQSNSLVYGGAQLDAVPLPAPAGSLLSNPQFSDHQDSILLDLKPFYKDSPALQTLTRRFLFDRSESSRFTVEDTVVFTSGLAQNFGVPVIRPYKADSTYNYTSLDADKTAYLITRGSTQVLVRVTANAMRGGLAVPPAPTEEATHPLALDGNFRWQRFIFKFSGAVETATVTTTYELVTQDPILLKVPDPIGTDGLVTVLVFTANPDRKVFYTTNGSTPTSASPFVLSGAKLKVASNSVVKAVKSGSAVVSSLSFSAYDRWRILKLGTLDDTGVFAALGDFDRDGINNGLEYAFNTNPKVPETTSPVTISQTGGRLRLDFYRRSDPALIYSVDGANALTPTGSTDWQELSRSTGAANVAGLVSFTDSVSLSTQPTRFLRLRITGPGFP